MKALFFSSEEPVSSWTWRRAIHMPQFGQNHFVELAPGRLGVGVTVLFTQAHSAHPVLIGSGVDLQIVAVLEVPQIIKTQFLTPSSSSRKIGRV